MIFEPDHSEIRPAMKMRKSTIRSVLVLLLASVTVTGCEKERLYSDYAGICGSWTIQEISGGFSGGGFEPDFDILQITSKMHFSLYFHETLLSEGRIEIIEQTTDKLRIEFNSKNNSGDPLTGWVKEVYLNLDTLVLNDDCCDMYSYFFVRTEI
jgi:hypothetical protein